MNLVLSIPGLPATPVEKTMRARADKWPFPGAVLPIEVDADDPSRMRVLWDEVPSGRSRGAAAAERIAAHMNGSPPARPVTQSTTPAPSSPIPGLGQIPPGARVVSSSTTINGQPASAEQIAAIESMIGMDLDGDGRIGGAPPQ